MSNTPNFDLASFYTDLDKHLYQAQLDLEHLIEAYGEAGMQHAKAYAEYRKAKAEACLRIREEGKPVGMVTDLANGATADVKQAEMEAEARVKKARLLVDAVTERINMLKYIGRTSETAGA